MGIDTMMAVTLHQGKAPGSLNARFRKTHNCEESLIGPTELLIGTPITEDYVSIAGVDTYWVNTGFARYYGRGYERGPCRKIILQLEWLRAQPEVLAVFYGPDSGDGPYIWTEAESIDLLKYYFANGNAPYARWCRATWA